LRNNPLSDRLDSRDLDRDTGRRLAKSVDGNREVLLGNAGGKLTGELGGEHERATLEEESI